jgi:hypothetical protein
VGSAFEGGIKISFQPQHTKYGFIRADRFLFDNARGYLDESKGTWRLPEFFRNAPNVYVILRAYSDFSNRQS